MVTNFDWVRQYVNLGVNERLTSWVILLVAIFAIISLSLTSLYLAKWYLRKFDTKKHSLLVQTLHNYHVFYRSVYFIPCLMTYVLLPLMQSSPLTFVPLISYLITKLLILYSIILGAFIISALLNGVEAYYKNFKISYQYPIKSYIQVIKIILAIFTGILIVATIMNKSPAYLFAGIGAMTAVLGLVFKDSILGFVASIQLTANDMVRIGDWVEVPAFGADGDVIDISLNTIKVQNFDKTIVTIPSYAFLTNGVKNWRGMNEAGGRRIKRPLFLEVTSIKFCDDALLARLKGIEILHPRLEAKLNEINESNKNAKVDVSLLANGRQLTNIGVFRMYVEEYLKHHPKTHKNMTFLVRQLQDTGKGIPLELYLFIHDTHWARYEAIQADIFDHLYAILPLFDLAPFQYMSGRSLDVLFRQSNFVPALDRSGS